MRRIDIAWEDIYYSSLKFLQPLTPRQTYKKIVDEAIKLLDAKEGTILLYKNKKFVRVYASFEAIKKLDVSPHGRTYKAFTSREPFSDEIKSKDDIQKPLYKRGFKTILFIPLAYGSTSEGVLNLFFIEKKTINQRTALKLKLFGAMISEILYKTEQFEKTEEALIARDMFIAMASHELRNPLTSILMTAQMIKNAVNEEKLPDKNFVDSLLTQSLWLSKLINETLTAHKAKNGKAKNIVGPVSVHEIMQLAITTFKATHQKYTVVLMDKEKRNNTYVRADFYKLLQVFVNLLNNAAKFSTNDKPITIIIERSSSFVVTRVSDKGCGISQKDLPKIFDDFYQGGKKNNGGMGLGLYLVKRIVDEYKGTITVQSQEKIGTTVDIFLPYYAKG